MSYRSLLLKSEPRFGAFVSSGLVTNAPTLTTWLREQGSVTRRLRALCSADFRVEVIGEGWRRPFLREARHLHVPARKLVWTREVALLAGARPLVLARSVIPREMLRGRHAQLAHLGQRPLGEWLFTNPDLRRLVLEFAQVPAANWRTGLATAAGRGVAVWGRRVLYRVARRRLLVCEFFLPELFRLEGEGRDVSV